MNSRSITDALMWRCATKKFDPARKVGEAELKILLEAARMAPTSFGLQPFRILAITDPAVRAKLRPAAWGQPQVTDASCLLVFAIITALDEAYVDRFTASIATTRKVGIESLSAYADMMKKFVNGIGPDQARAWSAKQAYIALGFLLEAAALTGIDCCPMEGFDPRQFDEILGLPAKGLSAVALCAVGHRAADDTYATLAKVRLSAEEMVTKI